MFQSRYMPCPECGASVERSETDHTCDVDRLLDYRMFGLREDIARLETDVRAWLGSNHGRFEAWIAQRQVRGV